MIIDFIKQNTANIIIILIVFSILYLCLKNLIDDKKKGTCGCGKSCSACGACSCKNIKFIEGLKRS